MVRLTRNQLQTQRDWAKTMVDKFLTIPPAGKTKKLYSSEYVDTYDLNMITEIEESDSFKEYVAKNAGRRQASRAAGKKKIAANITEKKKEIDSLSITIKINPNKTLDTIKDDAVKYYNNNIDYYDYDCEPREYLRRTPSNGHIIDRITVNYIRHDKIMMRGDSFTGGYDDFIEKYARKQETLNYYRKKIYNTIKKQYPELSVECDRQRIEREQHTNLQFNYYR